MKKRELTDKERQEWLEENGQLSKKTTKTSPMKPSASRQTKAPQTLEMGTAHLDKRRVQAAIDARIDLHGMTQERAHKAVIAFVKNAIEAHARTLLIITGKSGVLRTVVPKWLDTASLRPFILAISYATPKEGGEGALRVLIKKQR